MAKNGNGKCRLLESECESINDAVYYLRAHRYDIRRTRPISRSDVVMAINRDIADLQRVFERCCIRK